MCKTKLRSVRGGGCERMGVEGLEGSDGEFVVWAVRWKWVGVWGWGVEGEGCGEKGRG